MIRQVFRCWKTQQHAHRRNVLVFSRRNCSSFRGTEDSALEEDAERKIGWLLKSFFGVTAVYFGYQFFPYMGDNLLQQSLSLLQVKDPLFKRMGASRLSRYAIDDERRMKIIEMGGAERLVSMLQGAPDDRTRKEALKALDALSQSDVAAKALEEAGAIRIINSILISSDPDIVKYRSNLLRRFRDLQNEVPEVEIE